MKKTDKSYIRKVFIISKLALTLVLAFVIIKTAMTLWHPADIFAPTPAVGSEKIKVNNTPGPLDEAEDYSIIVERNIFGSAGSSSPANKSLSDEDCAEPTRSANEALDLVLLGTIAGSPAVSRAIIKVPYAELPGLYKTGDTVADATIERIEKDMVTLLHNGQSKTLRLNLASDRNEDNTQPYSSRTFKQTGNPARTNEPIRKTYTDIQTAIGHAELILEQAVIEPYKDGDQIEGLKITGLENIKMAEQLGLKDGDIIQIVNGQRLTSKQKAFQVFKKARTLPTLNIELLRNGETKRFSFNLR